MGCHRSGTNLLYDMLLSAGGFAVYRGYLPIYKILIPKFGPLDKLENRKKILDVWLRSKGFRRSGLDAALVSERVLNNCNNGGDFMRITMDEIARQQNVQRWAVYDPDTVLHVPRIKVDLPNAIFIHIVRDGRDIALSLMKMGGFRPFPWNRKQRGLLETALYWEWTVRKGREYGREIPANYVEIRYEDLISNPHQVLKDLGKFIDHDLDYDRIQRAALGRLSETNSSFREEPKEEQGHPVNRWKEKLSPREIAELEAIIGPCLQEFGYELSVAEKDRHPSLKDKWMHAAYPAILDTKLFLKIKTPLGRLADLSALELDSSETELNPATGVGPQ
jgi:hypothetical protein